MGARVVHAWYLLRPREPHRNYAFGASLLYSPRLSQPCDLRSVHVNLGKSPINALTA
ncbi:MAG: hypothetical protein AAGF12_21905 [Myxococcota bacterium]